MEACSMKITCLQKELAKGVSIANRAVSSRSTLPILSNIMLVAEGNELRISGTNLQMRIDCRIQAQVESPGAITVPAKLFWEIVSRLAGQHVALDVNPRTLMLAIGCGNYKAKINGLSAEDFPVPPKDDVLAVVTIKAGVLRQMIDQTAFAASTDMSRQNITGVEFVISGSRLGMAATDGYRLGVRAGALDEPATQESVIIIPATSLFEVSQALAMADAAERIKAEIHHNRISFHADGLDVSAQTLDGKFPDYRAILPKSFATTVTVDTKDLLRSLQVARILTQRGKDGLEHAELRVEKATNCLGISVVNAEVGDSGDSLEVEVTGEPTIITLDIGYIVDVLSRVEEEKVVLCLNGKNRPCVVQLPGVLEADFVQVIMPVSTKGDAR